MFSVLFKLKWFFREHWIRYTVAIVFLIVASAIEIIPPWLVGGAIDVITSGSMTGEQLTQYILYFIGLILIGYALNFTWQYQLFGGSIEIEKVLRTRLNRKFLSMTPTFYEKNRTGDLIARATNDLNAVSTTSGFGIMTLIDSMMYMAALILAMGFLISW